MPKSSRIRAIFANVLLALAVASFFAFADYRDTMRFDHPREPEPTQGITYEIQDKVVYYVSRDEYVRLSLLFYGSLALVALALVVAPWNSRDV